MNNKMTNSTAINILKAEIDFNKSILKYRDKDDPAREYYENKIEALRVAVGVLYEKER